jgi:endonuclease III
MEIVLDAHIIWNLLLTVVLTPLGLLIRSLLSEQKRLDILVNKTREEIAKEYVTRDQIELDFNRLMGTIERIDEKLDMLQSKTYFQE